MKKIFLFSLILVFSYASWAVPARIILIRHAEKPATNSDDLSEKGYERADALTKLFDLQPALASKGLPVALFAGKYVPGESAKRTIETLTPLSKKLNLEVQAPFLPTQDQELANLILKNPYFNGKTVMIAWKHTHIPALAKLLGSSPADQWNNETFDRIWLIDFDANGKASSQDIPENLLPGDSQEATAFLDKNVELASVCSILW